MIPESEWVWQGHPAHLCVADRCQFRLNTRVGRWVVSTVGEYYPIGSDMHNSKPEPIGGGKEALYETYVFGAGETLGCGCVDITDTEEVEGRRYGTAAEAQAGHLEMCRKYASVAQ